MRPISLKLRPDTTRTGSHPAAGSHPRPRLPRGRWGTSRSNMAAVPASAQPSDQRLPDKAAALVQHFPCRAHGLGLKNEAGALPGLTQPWGALRKEGVVVPPHKPGHSRTQLWTRRGGKPLPRLPVSPWVQVLLVATWAWAGVALKGPHSPGQGPGPAWQALSSVPGGASSPHGGARARPGSCPCQARPGRGQSVRRARRVRRHVWCVHTRERLHTHTAVRSAGSHGNRAAAGEGAPLPVPWERSPRAPALSGTLSACSTAGRGAGAALSLTLKCPEAASRGWGRQAGAAWL